MTEYETLWAIRDVLKHAKQWDGQRYVTVPLNVSTALILEDLVRKGLSLHQQNVHTDPAPSPAYSHGSPAQ